MGDDDHLTMSLSIIDFKGNIIDFQNFRNLRKNSLTIPLLQIFKLKDFCPPPQRVDYSPYCLGGLCISTCIFSASCYKADIGFRNTWLGVSWKQKQGNHVSVFIELMVYEGFGLFGRCIEQCQAHPMNSLNFIYSKNPPNY